MKYALGVIMLSVASACCAPASSAELPFPPGLTRPAPITVAELGKLKSDGVSVVEVSDYIFGGYKGELPSPPSADLNPKKAFVVFWKDYPFRFIFSHEGSYCPWFEFPDGAGICFQFFEGNQGWAELFNEWGRKEKNSFVDVIESGPKRVWVRWMYFGVNMASGEPAFRATEDFWAFPNGLILRRQTYRTLKPGKNIGYGREPIEMIGMCPVGKLWSDVLKTNKQTGERHALAVLDAFSPKRYDVYWKPKPTPDRIWDSTRRREGCNWKELDDSPGVAMVVPFREGSAFCVLGDAAGFRHKYTRIKEHSHRDTGANPVGVRVLRPLAHRLAQQPDERRQREDVAASSQPFLAGRNGPLGASERSRGAGDILQFVRNRRRRHGGDSLRGPALVGQRNSGDRPAGQRRRFAFAGP